jgi:hypothetical protein
MKRETGRGNQNINQHGVKTGRIRATNGKLKQPYCAGKLLY